MRKRRTRRKIYKNKIKNKTAPRALAVDLKVKGLYMRAFL